MIIIVISEFKIQQTKQRKEQTFHNHGAATHRDRWCLLYTLGRSRSWYLKKDKNSILLVLIEHLRYYQNKASSPLACMELEWGHIYAGEERTENEFEILFFKTCFEGSSGESLLDIEWVRECVHYWFQTTKRMSSIEKRELFFFKKDSLLFFNFIFCILHSLSFVFHSQRTKQA